MPLCAANVQRSMVAARGVSANGSRPSRAGRVIGLVRDGWIRGSLTARFRKDFGGGVAAPVEGPYGKLNGPWYSTV